MNRVKPKDWWRERGGAPASYSDVDADVRQRARIISVLESVQFNTGACVILLIIIAVGVWFS